MKRQIAFFYVAEAYQIYHSVTVAFELVRSGGFSVEIYYSDPATPAHIERVRNAWGAPPLPMHRLKRGALVRAVQALKRFGYWKEQVMRENAQALNRFDAIVCSESSDAYLRDAGVTRPLLIHMPHGAGARSVSYDPAIAKFDFVALPGERCVQRMNHEKLIRPGYYATPGYLKHEVVQCMERDRQPLFANGRPVVLYNPHRDRQLGSWPRFIEPVLDYFKSQEKYNLVVAPHVKMFQRMPQFVCERWQKRGTGNIRIDTGSWSVFDMTYTSAASLYIGDVSSQVFEYLMSPKPCIFLNPGKHDWRNDPDFGQWALGDVIEEPRQLANAIETAFARHALYRGQQIEMAAQSLGDISPGATSRAAEAIGAFVRRALP